MGNPSYNFNTCSGKYNVVIDQVISLTRNNNGTLNQGDTATWSELKTTLQTSTSPFVGLDNFYFTAKDLSLAESTGFNSTAFVNNLEAKCAAPIPGNKIQEQAICANGTFMNSFLFGVNGLFNGSSASFAGVLAPKQKDTTVLTWTRGYLMMTYANN